MGAGRIGRLRGADERSEFGVSEIMARPTRESSNTHQSYPQAPDVYQNKAHEVCGAPGLTRTGTPLRATDFESAASTNSATGALYKSGDDSQRKRAVNMLFDFLACPKGNTLVSGRIDT